MKKIASIFGLLISLSIICYGVSVDVKTKLKEKSELMAIKKGTIYWLEKNNVDVVNMDEDYAVWLKNLERKTLKENKYSYSLTVILSYPTSMAEKRAIRKEVVHFVIELDVPLKEKHEELDKRLRRRFRRIKNRWKKEAYIGGRVVADSIRKLIALDKET